LSNKNDDALVWRADDQYAEAWQPLIDS